MMKFFVIIAIAAILAPSEGFILKKGLKKLPIKFPITLPVQLPISLPLPSITFGDSSTTTEESSTTTESTSTTTESESSPPSSGSGSSSSSSSSTSTSTSTSTSNGNTSSSSSSSDDSPPQFFRSVQSYYTLPSTSYIRAAPSYISTPYFYSSLPVAATYARTAPQVYYINNPTYLN